MRRGKLIVVCLLVLAAARGGRLVAQADGSDAEGATGAVAVEAPAEAGLVSAAAAGSTGAAESSSVGEAGVAASASGRHSLALDFGRALRVLSDPTLLELELNYRWPALGLYWDTAFTWSTSLLATDDLPLLTQYRLSVGPVFRVPQRLAAEGFWWRPRFFLAWASLRLPEEPSRPTETQWLLGPEIGLGYTLFLGKTRWFIDPWLGARLIFAPQEKGLYPVPLLCLYLGYAF